MTTSPTTIDDLLGRLGDAFRARRMFGEYAVYRGDVVVALVCDDALYVKDTAAGRATMEPSVALDAASPYPGARPHLRLTADLWDDAEWLRLLLHRTAAALPAAKPKRSRTPAGSPGKR